MRLPQDRILHIDTEFKDGKVNIVAEWRGELVRCKDCIHYESDEMVCGIDDMVVDRIDYCSYGERRELDKGGDNE